MCVVHQTRVEERMVATVHRVQSALQSAKCEVQSSEEACIIAEDDLETDFGRETLRKSLSTRRHCVIRRSTAFSTKLVEDYRSFPPAQPIQNRPEEFIGLFADPHTDSKFLECRFGLDGTLDPKCPAKINDLGHSLGSLGLRILSSLDDPTYARLCDIPLERKRNEVSTTVFRLCRYESIKEDVAFGSHTDTTFLTLVPCASQPGLEVFDPSIGAFLCHEASPLACPGRDVICLAGEFLDLLSNGKYGSAVHRVILTSADAKQRRTTRSSTPLLLRAKRSASWLCLPLTTIWKVLAKASSEEEVRQMLIEQQQYG